MEPTAELDDVTIIAIAELRKLGYSVEVEASFDEEHVGENVDVYRIEGFGISVLYRSDDIEAFNALADPDAHAERLRQREELAQEAPEE
jgi:hypothetical protein